ncbi:MAG: hypothetical protein WCK64_03300 [Synechococcaceae cyanobacterium ELA445]
MIESKVALKEPEGAGLRLECQAVKAQGFSQETIETRVGTHIQEALQARGKETQQLNGAELIGRAAKAFLRTHEAEAMACVPRRA